jgi:hypothetical protein
MLHGSGKVGGKIFSLDDCWKKFFMAVCIEGGKFWTWQFWEYCQNANHYMVVEKLCGQILGPCAFGESSSWLFAMVGGNFGILIFE